ncbi:MAG: UDP-N-acetylmuramate dehydrogenase [Coriobacteriia bacterium]|nr:UDP-N-acetylmuramate dehydrogenase [Coriobacteriia bacterium]
MSSFDAYLSLKGIISGDVLADEKLAFHTSYRIGGPADLFITVDNYNDLRTTIAILESNAIPWVMFGKGTNILVSDEGYRGAVIVLGKEFNHFAFDEEDPTRVSVGAGVSIARMVQESFRRGLSGLEMLVGVPGTVGGAVVMNAGTREQWIGQVVESLVVYRPHEGLKRYMHKDIAWFYRQTTIAPQDIVLEVVLALRQSDIVHLRAKMEASLSKRKKSQPLNKASCGSVFLNPPDKSVAQLIEAAGLKGYQHGGAQVSDVHANFIVNNGRASAQDVLSVMKVVKDKVGRLYGVELKPEVKFLGFEKN